MTSNDEYNGLKYPSKYAQAERMIAEGWTSEDRAEIYDTMVVNGYCDDEDVEILVAFMARIEEASA